MSDEPRPGIQVTGDVAGSVLVTGSQNVIIQAGQVMLQAAAAARLQRQDPARMLRVLAVLAAPVYDPDQPDSLPPPLDFQQEWHKLTESVRKSGAPILLARLIPPTLDALRAALSPRAETQGIFPHILHFSGHAWAGGLFLEDEWGQVHAVTTGELLAALKGLPRPLDLVVLNGCETAADDARSMAQALLKAGRARAVVGHPLPVWDPEAVAFAGRLYAELAGGFPLGEAVGRARSAVTTHDVLLEGDAALDFREYLGPGEPVVDDRRPSGNLPSRAPFFFGRGRELVDLARTLAHPPAVGVVTGPSGIGKTSLLVEAAHRNAWRFPGGVAFARGPRPEENRPGTAADLLTQLAAGLKIEATLDRIADALREHVALAPTLLLLDNLESLPEGERARLGEFLRHLGAESAALLALRPPCPVLEDLPRAHPLPLHGGIGREAAVHYALALAAERRVPLNRRQAGEIASATDGHPRLIELVLARARVRDRDALLQEVWERRGDFAAQLDRVYEWSAARLDEAGRAAWQALLLFPAGAAPERVFRAAAGPPGVEALREAALADFHPADQLWRWHGSVADYARLHWPLAEEERRAWQAALLPEWTAWLEGLRGEAETVRHRRLEMTLADLEDGLEAARAAPREVARAFLGALHRALPKPDRTLALRPFEEAAYRAWADLATDADERAWAQNMLGWALSALGRREEALRATQEAVGIYRGLAEQNPQAFLPYLAGSLNNLGNRLSELGRREEALTATQEAVGIYRGLAEQNPQAFLPYLAGSLNNLGGMLSALGRREEALAATQEAVDIYRQLAQANPQAFLPDLAGSLNNLGAMLSELGRWEEALAATQEAADLYRGLARENPQAFRPYLATSLNNLGRDLSALGRWEEALAATQEAVAIRRQLAAANPQAFLPDLATSLNNLGNRLSELGRREEALVATWEAADLYRGLAEQNPQAFLPYLAGSLNNLGARLSKLGRREEALAAYEEAVRTLLPFFQAFPAAFAGWMQRMLENYLRACEEAGREPDWGLVEEVGRSLR